MDLPCHGMAFLARSPAGPELIPDSLDDVSWGVLEGNDFVLAFGELRRLRKVKHGRWCCRFASHGRFLSELAVDFLQESFVKAPAARAVHQRMVKGKDDILRAADFVLGRSGGFYDGYSPGWPVFNVFPELVVVPSMLSSHLIVVLLNGLAFECGEGYMVAKIDAFDVTEGGFICVLSQDPNSKHGLC